MPRVGAVGRDPRILLGRAEEEARGAAGAWAGEEAEVVGPAEGAVRGEG
jgi:hypothetical protein